MDFAIGQKGEMMNDSIDKQAAIDTALEFIVEYLGGAFDEDFQKELSKRMLELPSAQPEEVIPHRNYKYLSDYWCECGWHLGKKGEVKYCSECGRKVNWDG